MIQILALREFFSKVKQKNVKAEVWFDRGIRAASVEELFSNPSLINEKVEPSERWNVYYTVSECLEQKGRKLKIQHHIPFDVDKLDIPVNENNEVDRHYLKRVALVACEAIGVEYEKCGILFSGNGIQILVGTTKPIEEEAYFDQVRKNYGAICDRIDLRLVQANIKGEADRSVWSPARLMRFPQTQNRKPGKPERLGFILNSTIERTNYDIKEASGLPDHENTESIADNVVKAFPTPDVKTIMNECKFLAYAQTNPEKLDEPLWYAALSITARFPEGKKISHQMSKGHPGYNYDETETKIAQAVESSGPRTCKDIENRGFKCVGCKHYKTGIKSPILIEGPNHIKTEKSGFHNVFITKEGETKKGKPNYEDLAKYFEKQHPYVSVDTARTVWTFDGKAYTEMSRDRVLQFAHDQFNPKPTTNIRNEFFETMRLKNMVATDWFASSIEGKMNFQNGVFDVKRGELLAHSQDYGFRSVLPCDFDPNAKAPRFEKFMEEITMGRQTLIETMQEFLGYIFANGSCKHDKILVLLGHGENGKSKFVQLIRYLTGEEGFSNLSVKAMQNDQNRALMEGKLVNIAEENNRDAFKDTELLKNYAAGGYISVKRLYAQPYEYENRTKLVMLCNEAPYTTDLTHGFYRRLLMIPFDQTFSHEKGNRDSDLLEKLLAELPGIFNFAMEGYRRLQKNNKFTEGKESLAMLHKYRLDTDSIAAWMADNLEFDKDPDVFINRQELYDDYAKYCDMNGLKPVSSVKVYEGLRKFVSRHGCIAKEEKKRKDNMRIQAINHIRHIGLSNF